MNLGFLAPAALLLLPLLGVVVVMYMLRLRRDDRRVPSTLLWRAVVQEPPANAPWQRLRITPLLLLQLLGLLLLILALARPFLPTEDLVGRNLIVLVDRSASMAATDGVRAGLDVARGRVGGGSSRLDQARRELLDLAASASGARLTVIAFDESMEVLAAAEGDPSEIERAVADLEVVPVEGDISDALAFAEALAEGQDDTQIVVISDGGLAAAPGAEVAAPVRFVAVGSSSNNQGVTALSLSSGAAGSPSEVFVQVTNFGTGAVTRRVELDVDGALYDARDVVMPGGGRQAFSVAVPDEVGTVQVRLTGTDALPLDDAMWAVRPHASKARVTMVGDGNRFLHTALSLLPSVEEVTELGPEFADGPFGIADVLVFDGVVPGSPVVAGTARGAGEGREEPPSTSPTARLGPPAMGTHVAPGSNVLLVGPTTSTLGIEYLGELSRPVPRVVDPEHHLVAGMELDQVSILRSAALELGPQWRSVLAADVDGRSWPLIAEGTVGGVDAVVIAFDVRESDLPLRPAFPLLIASAVDALAPASLAGVPASVALGQPLSLDLPPDGASLKVMAADGREMPLEIDGRNARLAGLDRPGVYTLELETADGVVSTSFAVNFHAPVEQDIAPDPDLRFGVSGSSGEGEPRTAGRRELWWLLGMAALGVLMVEWTYFYRRTLGGLRAGRSQGAAPGVKGRPPSGARPRRPRSSASLPDTSAWPRWRHRR